MQKTSYRIKINGEIRPEAYGSAGEALNAVHAIFDAGETAKCADIIRYTEENAITVRNKNHTEN